MISSDFQVKDSFLVGYFGANEDVEIPECVTAIGDFAFEGNENIRSVTLHGGIRMIGRAAFARCKNLETVNICGAVESIEPFTFHECKSLKTVRLAYGVNRIEKMAFYGSELKCIEIPDSVTFIGYAAFGECENLKRVILPKYLKTISSRAFCGCRSLQELELGAAEAELGAEIFFEASPKINVKYGGASADLLRMVRSKLRIVHPWDTNVSLHYPSETYKNTFVYESEKSFSVTVVCEGDGEELIFKSGNANRK